MYNFKILFKSQMFYVEFDAMLKLYIAEFASKTATSADFQQFFLKHFDAKVWFICVFF